MRAGPGRGSWILFAAWLAEGALLALVVVAAASFGLFLLPVAALLLWWLVRAGGMSAELLGGLCGLGLPPLLVAGLALGADGYDARPWFLAGIVLVAGGLGWYWALRRRGQPPSAVV